MIIRSFAGSLIKSMAIEACANLSEVKQRRIYELLEIADGKIFKSKCDFGTHDFECVKTYWMERGYTADSYDRRYEKKG